jgi:putative peptidoglycan lipid II flippase
MMVTVLASRLLGVLRDAIISHYFGRSATTDAYQAAFTVPDLLFYLLQSGALSSTIVPIITEYRQLGKHKEADYTVSVVASTIFVVIGLLICVMWIKARALTIWLNPGFDTTRIDMAIPLTRVLLPAQMFFFMGGLMMGVLYSRKQFLIPALGPVIYNSGIIFGGIVLRYWLGIEGLVWGAIGGAFIGNFLIPFIAVRRLGVHLRFSLHVLHPAARKVWIMLLPMGLGVALPNIDQIVNKLFASYLGNGETTAIMNAYRLMLLPIGIFAQALALAVYPTFATQAGLKDFKGLRASMNSSLRNILFMTVPSSVLMFLLATPVITLLLQSGKYTAADTAATAGALMALSLGIFAWSTQSLLTRGFYALQNSRIPVISGICVSVVFVFMNWYVIFHTHLGVVGLGLSTSIAAAIHATALTILLSRRLQGIHGGLLFVSTVKTLLATAGLGLAAWVVRNGLTIVFPLTHTPKLSALIILLGSSLAGVAVFMGIAKMLHMPELRDALALVRRFRKKAAPTG